MGRTIPQRKRTRVYASGKSKHQECVQHTHLKEIFSTESAAQPPPPPPPPVVRSRRRLMDGQTVGRFGPSESAKFGESIARKPIAQVMIFVRISV